ncbi:hypothetical protein CARUB_v10002325mg [Capsella rubella]|uniref:Uncharacterized protein n=1 Tax=Capsella rubella TaxID=81985 RepID=R0GQZ6_9BRAS|nr:hypothetical protein CARUB_v10002325mg [Capsella rubella]
MTAEFDAIHHSKGTKSKFIDLSHEVLMAQTKTTDPAEFQARKSLGPRVENLYMLCKKIDEVPKIGKNVRTKNLTYTQNRSVHRKLGCEAYSPGKSAIPTSL